MFRLYDYAASCNCYKVRLLLAQLGLRTSAYRSTYSPARRSPTSTHINPARTTPVLETERGYLCESNAILAYIAAGTPLLPGEPFELAEVMRWLIFEQTDVIPTMGGLRFRLLVGRLKPDDPDAVRRRDERVRGAWPARRASRPARVLRRRPLHDRGHRRLLYTPRARGRAWTWSRMPTFEVVHPVEAQPGYMEDVAPYGANAAPGVGRSIYD